MHFSAGTDGIRAAVVKETCVHAQMAGPFHKTTLPAVEGLNRRIALIAPECWIKQIYQLSGKQYRTIQATLLRPTGGKQSTFVFPRRRDAVLGRLVKRLSAFTYRGERNRKPGLSSYTT